MSVVRDAPEVVIRNVLRGDWTPANVDNWVVDTDVAIHHGWLDPDYDLPEITISNPEESPINGGQTGYSGFKPDGSGPTQDIAGTVEVNTWASRPRLLNLTNGSIENPRQAIYLMKHEVERLLRAHAQGTDENDNPTDLRRLSYLGATRFVENQADDDRDTVYRYRVLAGYGFHAR